MRERGRAIGLSVNFLTFWFKLTGMRSPNLIVLFLLWLSKGSRSHWLSSTSSFPNGSSSFPTLFFLFGMECIFQFSREIARPASVSKLPQELSSYSRQSITRQTSAATTTITTLTITITETQLVLFRFLVDRVQFYSIGLK